VTISGSLRRSHRSPLRSPRQLHSKKLAGLQLATISFSGTGLLQPCRTAGPTRYRPGRPGPLPEDRQARWSGSASLPTAPCLRPGAATGWLRSAARPPQGPQLNFQPGRVPSGPSRYLPITSALCTAGMTGPFTGTTCRTMPASGHGKAAGGQQPSPFLLTAAPSSSGMKMAACTCWTSVTGRYFRRYRFIRHRVPPLPLLPAVHPLPAGMPTVRSQWQIPQIKAACGF
jgi:hypothetical protein